MTPIQLEALTLRMVDQVRAGQPVEDSLIELKREWPEDPYKAARRIGGHANASRGQTVVWIIGLDEREGVTGTDAAELSDWWPQVQRHFDDVPPELALSLNVSVEGDGGTRQTVVALAFDTSRLPFVVKADGQAGTIQREVPYRDATGVRSAKRADIIRLALPPSPRIEGDVLAGSISLGTYNNGPTMDPYSGWHVDLSVYLTLIGDGRLIFPGHLCTGRIETRGGPPVELAPWYVGDETNQHVTKSGNDLIVTGPGRMELRARCLDTRDLMQPHRVVRLSVELRGVEADAPLTLSLDMAERDDDAALMAVLTDERTWLPLL